MEQTSFIGYYTGDHQPARIAAAAMNARLLLVSLLSLSFSGLPAQACPTARNPNTLDYIRRDNNRCEGIRPRSVVSGGGMQLISLSTVPSETLGSNLTLRVPKGSGGLPTVLVRAIDQRYQLDQMTLSNGGQFYSFALPTTILRRASINPTHLRATATSGDWVVYLPVILQNASSQYRLVFYSSSTYQFQRAEIRRNRQLVASWGEQNSRAGAISFDWNPGSAPVGRYEFYYEADILPITGRRERISASIFFEHHPDWLR